MRNYNFSHNIRTRFGLYFVLLNLFIGPFHLVSRAQCPDNIDFETGTFNGWRCYIGNALTSGTQNLISLSPVSGPVFTRHTMNGPGAGFDPYGGFPINCPNGSKYSVRLGNNSSGTEAEGMSYEFTIPPGANTYSLIYHYAVVFQDPSHEPFQQPRMEIEIWNQSDDSLLTCSSFTFFPNGSPLPGFFQSPNPGDTTPVWCKNWTAVTVNLNGNAGKNIRMFFKTADCTFRRHFGYAYIDVNSECSSEFVGATFCPQDTAVYVTAPYGYQSYIWYNQDFSQVIGTTQTLNLSPPPLAGTTVAVAVVPYDGYGCIDTLYAKLVDTLNVVANAGKDTFSCNRKPVPIGSNAKPGLVYSWSPTIGLDDPGISNPLAGPPTDTKYVVSVRSQGGGCLKTDTVFVRASVIDSSLTIVGKLAYCIDSEDSAVLYVKPTDSIQWFRNGKPISGANLVRYRVPQEGVYHALLFNLDGCSIETKKVQVQIGQPKVAIQYPIEYAVINLPLSLQSRDFGGPVLWKPSVSLDDPSSITPVFQGTLDQLYLIEIMAADGCLTVDTQRVKVIEKIDIYVPNAFTPNNDGSNDVLRPLLRGVKELHYFRVFNRWGMLLYQTKTKYQGWDGRYKGLPQGTQVVVWIAEGIGVDGKIYRGKGTATLLR